MAHGADVEWRGDVATLSVGQKENYNVLSADVLEGTINALEGATDADVLIVTGSGSDVFSVGANLKDLSSSSVEEAHRIASLGHELCNRIQEFPAPVIGAINGYAFGGGCEIALACDIRVAASGAVLGQTEIDLGIIPGWGGTQRLSRIVGDETARRMVFFGERLNAETALEYGLVSEVVDDDALEEHVRSMAEKLSEKPTFALRAAKEALNQVHETHQSAGLTFEERSWSSLFGTDDQREGMAAFLEKREPDFD